MKQSEQTFAEYRKQIDTLDDRIIDALAQRTVIVRKLMVHKTSEEEVRGCDRVRIVLDGVRSKARQLGMPEDIAERTYAALIEALTDMQLAYLKERNIGG